MGGGSSTSGAGTTMINGTLTSTSETSSTGPGGTSTSSSESSGSSDPPPTCEEITATLAPITPNIMLTLDKTGSMVANPNGHWDHDNDPNTPTITRWNSLHQVVENVVNANDAAINFGANLFPSKMAAPQYDISACPVNPEPEAPVAPMNGPTILGVLPPANDLTISGGTAGAAGVTAAFDHLRSLDPGVPRAVVYVTDGAANCKSDAVTDSERFEVYDPSLHTIVETAYMVDGIPTYVVGIDISDVTSTDVQDGNPNGINPFQKLNELAEQGGKAKADLNEKFYNAVNQLELQAALDLVVYDALTCIIPLESEPPFPDSTTVEIMGVEIPVVRDCSVEDGWVYTNPLGPYDGIELCGAACDELKLAGEADVSYHCF